MIIRGRNEVANQFATLPGCTINDEMKNRYAFHWDVERIKYLGIKLTKNLDNLNKEKKQNTLNCQKKWVV
uniref:Uncharacterized protein n=1 Tax=Seriola lalandi dorsalis TaxID=1841481 RepID=A0A3B4X121_SERLL